MNKDIYKDLATSTIKEEIVIFSSSYLDRLSHYTNKGVKIYLNVT